MSETSTPPDTSSAPELTYAPRPRLARIRRWRWRIALLAVVVAIAIPLYRNRESLSLRARWLYWSHQCASHQMPPDVELVVTDPQRAQQLLATNPDYVPQASRRGVLASTQPIAAVYVPRAWRKLAAVDPRCSWIEPRFYDEPLVFLGSLRRPDGASRLVAIGGSDTNGLRLLHGTRVLVLPNPGFTDALPKRISSYGWVYSGKNVPASLRAGRIDPQDPAHITIDVVVHGIGPDDGMDKIEATGTLDAYLQDDDSLTFTLRDNPEWERLHVELGRDRISGVIPPRAYTGW